MKLMVEIMDLLKKNDLPLQPGTADIVFRYACYVKEGLRLWPFLFLLKLVCVCSNFIFFFSCI